MINKTNMLKYCILIFSMSFLLYACATAQGVNSKDYGCAELRQLIQSEGSLDIQGLLGVTTAHANPRACSGINQIPRRTTWRSSDKYFCVAGFTCQHYNVDDDD